MTGYRAFAAALLLLAALNRSTAHAEDFYVAPDGDDGNVGTIDQPFATVERGQEAASAGDTVFIRDGVYELSGSSDTIGVAFTKSGSAGQPIKYFAYPGEQPIFDLFNLTPNDRVTGLDVRTSWIHIRGLEVRGVQQIVVGDSWGVRIRGDNNVIEHLDVHNNEAPGIFITSGANNLILNCDSHHNYDPLENGGNADGFGCHSTGAGNVLRGCRAWENSDDGYDFINAAGACTVEGSWAMRNGWVPDTNQAAANGAGFKSGGYGNPPNTPGSGAARHVVRFSVAFDNRSNGFYANYHPGGLDFVSNTAFDNPVNYDMRPAPGIATSHMLRNNIAGPGGNDVASWSGGTNAFNSWTSTVTVSSDDFLSLDTTLAYAPREADGSLPSTMLARLREDSDLIDRGEDIGFPFAGSAPDLGAFEHGLVPVEPDDAGVPDGSIDGDAGVVSGGAGGASGASGMGGGVGGAGGASGMTAPMDAGTQPPLAGMSGGAPAGSGGMIAAPTGSDTSEASGCGCRIEPSRSTTSAPLLLLGVALVALYRVTWSRAARKRSRASPSRRSLA